MRDKCNYRAANGRAQGADSGLFAGLWRAEKPFPQRFVRTEAALEIQAVPVTALSNMAFLPTTNQLVSMAYQCNPSRALALAARRKG